MSLNLIRTILENPGCATGSSWALLIAMADRADDDGKGVYASMRVMAEICGISNARHGTPSNHCSKPRS